MICVYLLAVIFDAAFSIVGLAPGNFNDRILREQLTSEDTEEKNSSNTPTRWRAYRREYHYIHFYCYSIHTKSSAMSIQNHIPFVLE